MKLLILLFCVLNFQAAFAEDVPCNSPATALLCELSWTEGANSNIEMQAYKTICNFPEGNVRPCVNFRICVNNNRVEVGSLPIFEVDSLDTVCKLKSPLDLMGSSQISKPTIFAVCNGKKSTSELIFKSGQQSIKCKIDLTKVLQ